MHIDDVIGVDHEVRAFGEMHAHLLGEERMLEVRRVVDARGQHRDGWRFTGPGRERGKQIEELRRVTVNRVDLEVTEQVGEHPLRHLPVLEHVRHARGHPQVVFEHVHRAVGVADKVAAADVRPHAELGLHAHALGSEVHRRGEDRFREHAIGDDFAITVEVVDEQVQRREPLDQSGGDRLPLVGRDHPWDHIEGPRPVDVAGLGVDGEGDAHGLHGQLRSLLTLLQFLHGQRREVAGNTGTRRTRSAIDDHFIPAVGLLVVRPMRAGHWTTFTR